MPLTDAFVAQSPLSIALYDAEGRLAFGNAAYERHFGVRVADVPATFSLFTDPQLAAAGLLEPIRRAYEGEPVVLPPVRYDAALASDGAGREVWTEGHCFPLRDAGGVVTHLAIVHLDVTAWAATDAALRELSATAESARAVAEQERARLNQILAQMPAALAVYEGPELRVRAMSAAYRRMIGGRDALGLPVREALADMAGQGFFERMEHVYATGQPVGGTNMPALWDADGDGVPEERVIDFAYGPLMDAAGRPDGVVALVIDASERAQAQAAERAAMSAAAESAARLAAVLEALPDAAVVYDADWRCTYLNPAARALHAEIVRVTGAVPPGESAVGQVVWELFPWLAGTQFERESRRAVAERRVAEYVERAAPLGRWFETRVVPIATGIVTLNRDVTVQRAVDEQREQLLEAERVAAERVQRLQHLTARLNRATTTAQIADAILEGGIAAVGADAGALSIVLRDPAGLPADLELVRSEGYSAELAARWDRFPIEAGRPLSHAVLHGAPVFIASRAEWSSSWPLAGGDLASLAYEGFIALPVRAGERVVAVLTFSFLAERQFDDATRTYLATLGEQCALALERQRIHEAELRVTEQQSALLETIQDAFVALDRELRVTYVNRRAEELLRRRGSAIIGLTVDEAFPEARGTPIRQAVNAALEHGESAHSEEWSEVTRTWVDVRVSPAPGGVTLLLQDITTRRREQQATAFMAEASRLLSESLDYLATLRAVAEAAVPQLGDWCAVDVIEDPMAKRWPPVLERVAAVHRDRDKLGLGLELARRRTVDWDGNTGMSAVLRDAVPAFIPEVTDDMVVAAASDAEHLRILRELAFTSIIVVPLVAHGHTLGAITLCLSAGRRRYDEHDLALAQDLAQRAAIAVDNARHFRDAERARTEAEEANLTKSQFLATMSHELRTPLNAIAGHVQLIDLGLHGPVTDAQRDALGRVDRAQRRLLGLINDVLSFARLESGYVEYDIQPVDLGDVVRDIAPLVEPQLRAQGLEFDVQLDPPPGTQPLRVLADREKLGQILLNLISNAIKFTPAGGRVTVDLASRGDGTGPTDVAFLRVSDTGIGVPQDKLEAIFDPFVQVRPSAYTPGSGGTGLGLAISRDLARAMGGDVRARGSAGGGSTFTVTLRRG